MNNICYEDIDFHKLTIYSIGGNDRNVTHIE